MEIQQLLTMKPYEIKYHYGARNPILEEGGNDRLPSSIPIVKSYPPSHSATLGDILEYLSSPPKWCIHDHPDPSGRSGNPKLLVAVVGGQIIPKGQLRVENIRYAFGGAVNYQEIVESYNSN